MTDEDRRGFHYYYRNVDPIRTTFQEKLFMTVVTLALMVALPTAIAGIFWGIAKLGAAWGGGR